MPVTGSYYGPASAFRELAVAVKLTTEPLAGEAPLPAPVGRAGRLTPRRKSARGSSTP